MITEVKEITHLTSSLKELLLLADPDWSQVRTYIESSVILGIYENETCIGLIAAHFENDQCEIKNISIRPDFQHKGLGSRLINEIIHIAQNDKVKTITVKTGNSSLAAIALYEKMGFNLHQTDAGFFLRNYPKPIYENGRKCVDQLIFKRFL